MERADIVIIGAGFAGAATAYCLARRGAGSLLLLEREVAPGMHASGQNAAMVRRVVLDEAIQPLALEGASFLGQPPSDWPGELTFQQTGSLLLACGSELDHLREVANLYSQTGLGVGFKTPQEANGLVPPLRGGDFEGAIWCPVDGVIDIHALLGGYLRFAQASGARLLTGCQVTGFRHRNGAITAVETSGGTVATGCVVNAAGAWAEQIALLARGTKVPLHPLRRHLFVTGPLPWIEPNWPFVWDVTHGFYFRPESGGLLLSPCDEEAFPPSTPPLDPQASELLAVKLSRHLPSLAGLPIQRGWAGLRTFAGDHRFVIGWDPLVRGLFWVAGLGGHGVTTSAAVGRLAADLIMGREQTADTAHPFTPTRFL